MTALTDTVLLCHFDNAIQDDGYYAHTLTAAGSAALSTTFAKFGNQSLKFTGTSDTVTVADSGVFTPSGDLTLEVWVYIVGPTAPASVTFWTQIDGPTNEITLSLMSGTLQFLIKESSTDEIDLNGTPTLAVGAWHHIAVTRSGDDWYLFANGVQVATVNKSYTYPNLPGDITLKGTDETKDVYFDDLRFIDGTAAYTAAFDVPTAAHSLDSGYDDLAEDVDDFFREFGEKVLYTPSGGTARLIDAIIDRQPPGSLGTTGQGLRAVITVRNNPTTGIDGGDDNPLEDTVTVEPELGHARIAWPLSFKRHQDNGLISYEI